MTCITLPAPCDGTNVPTDALLRSSDHAEFAHQQPEFDGDAEIIFAVDLVCFPPGGKPTQHTFFIAANDVTAEKCRTGDASPIARYTNPFAGEPFPCPKNGAPGIRTRESGRHFDSISRNEKPAQLKFTLKKLVS